MMPSEIINRIARTENSGLGAPRFPTAAARILGLLAVAAAAGTSGPALAGPDGEPDEDRPATWDMTLEELKAVGLGQYRGDPVPLPPGTPLTHDPAKPRPAKQGVIFVNFDGAELSYGPDDSRMNRTLLSELVGTFPPYGAGSKREAVMQAVREDWAPFNVIVTDTRPASGDYTMNMVGPKNPYGPVVLGVALLDCNDAETHNNITYAFHSANDQFSATTQATTIGQEVAHSYGLEHVDDPSDIMNPSNAGGDPSFRDECIPIVNGGACAPQHAAQCGSGTMQNSYRELLALFGPAVADESPPSVAITAPADGAQFDVGADFEITASAQDDTGVEKVDLYVDGQFQQSDGSEPYGWSVEDIPAGTYELYVVARDLAGNESTSDVVTIYVGQAPPDGESGGGGDGGGGSGDGGGDSGGGDGTDPVDPYEPDGGALPPGFGFRQDAGEGGCGCRAPSPWRPGPAALLVLPFIARRRR